MITVEEYLLTTLAEECLEAGQDICKALRFGIDEVLLNPDGSIHPKNPKRLTNRERILEEMNDVMAMMDMCVAQGIFRGTWGNHKAQDTKVDKVFRYLDYAQSIGHVTKEKSNENSSN